MIDIHCHLLPALDDGSSSKKETKEMLSLAVEEGIEAIVATPHWESGMSERWEKAYQRAYEGVQQLIQEAQIPIKVYAGSEIFQNEGRLYSAEHGLHTMNQTRYILVEFPFHTSFSHIQRSVLNLSYEGYWPILAHIERYDALKDLQRVEELVEMGAYIQVNTSSIAGANGWMQKRYCLRLMRANLLHFVGTDAHGSTKRPPKAKKALAFMEQKMGKAYTTRITKTNPQNMIKGERISGED